MTPSIAIETVLVSVPGTASPMTAYVARPTTAGPHPSVIVCMWLFGVDGHVRDVTDCLARLGYVAIAPDLNHRTEPNIVLGYDDAGRARGLELLKKLRREEVIGDIRATLDYLHQRSDTTRKTGILGLSSGGHIAYLAATQLDLAAVISFYGGWIANTDIPLSQPEATLTLTPGIKKQGGHVLYLVGSADHLITADQNEAVERALSAVGVPHDVVVYPNVKHGYFCAASPAYDRAASEDSWKRVERLLQEQLRPDAS